MMKQLSFVVLAFAATICSSLAVSQQDQRDADIQAVFKMSPKDVLRLRDASGQHEDAQYRELNDPKILSDESELNLAPGEDVPFVYILQRAPTTISFVDATGTAWPIKKVKAYDGDLFGAEAVENSFNNSLVITGNLPAGTSYLTVFLRELATPITVKVKVSREKYHHSKTIKIMDVGPETQLNVMTLGAASQIGLEADPDLNNVIYGVKPFESTKLNTDNREFIAWQKGSEILIRTRMNIFSPAPIRFKVGHNGYAAYRLNKTSRIFATNSSGKVVRVKVESK